MPRYKNGVKTYSCGCLYFEVGPPVLCAACAAREQLKEEKGLRRAVREQAESLGHELTRFAEYESTPGKWTAFCTKCERLVIVYDEVPSRGDQVNGKRVLEERCRP